MTGKRSVASFFLSKNPTPNNNPNHQPTRHFWIGWKKCSVFVNYMTILKGAVGGDPKLPALLEMFWPGCRITRRTSHQQIHANWARSRKAMESWAIRYLVVVVMTCQKNFVTFGISLEKSVKLSVDLWQAVLRLNICMVCGKIRKILIHIIVTTEHNTNQPGSSFPRDDMHHHRVVAQKGYEPVSTRCGHNWSLAVTLCLDAAANDPPRNPGPEAVGWSSRVQTACRIHLTYSVCTLFREHVWLSATRVQWLWTWGTEGKKCLREFIFAF